MRRVILIGVLAWGLLWSAQCLAGPVAQVKETSVDAGQALQGQKVKGVFFVDNPGDEVLEIKKVSPG